MTTHMHLQMILDWPYETKRLHRNKTKNKATTDVAAAAAAAPAAHLTLATTCVPASQKHAPRRPVKTEASKL